jgi:hypothetical protein
MGIIIVALDARLGVMWSSSCRRIVPSFGSWRIRPADDGRLLRPVSESRGWSQSQTKLVAQVANFIQTGVVISVNLTM